MFPRLTNLARRLQADIPRPNPMLRPLDQAEFPGTGQTVPLFGRVFEGWENPVDRLRVQPPPHVGLNELQPPWGYTSTRPGRLLPSPTDHYQVAHPNADHGQMPMVSPFAGVDGSNAGLAGRALNHSPNYVAPGLAPGGRR